MFKNYLARDQIMLKVIKKTQNFQILVHKSFNFTDEKPRA
jgi:hypothetical protein